MIHGLLLNLEDPVFDLALVGTVLLAVFRERVVGVLERVLPEPHDDYDDWESALRSEERRQAARRSLGRGWWE